MTTKFFIVLSKSDCKSYARQTDRDFFSVPVQVVPIGRTDSGLTKVVSPLQGGCEYPVENRNLKAWFSLSNKQRNSARLIPEHAQEQ